MKSANVFSAQFPLYRIAQHRLCDYTWSNRARLELRIFGDRSDIVRFRNKIGIAGPWQWTALNLKPYVAYELFVDSGQEGRPSSPA